MSDAPGSTLTAPEDTSSGLVEVNLVLLLEGGRPHAGSVRYRIGELATITLGRGAERRASRTGSELAIEVPDKLMSSLHARIERSAGRWLFIDESKNGSFVDGHPAKRVALAHGSLIELGRTVFVFLDGVAMAGDEAAVLELPLGTGALETLVPQWQAELARLGKVAGARIPVMIEGEPGVGKQYLARAIHALSGRAGELIQFNCGELAPDLVDGELFGDEDFAGLLIAASGGTLLLDDVGELPASSQSRLLRVLLEGALVAGDGSHTVALDLRVISSTDCALEGRIRSGTFRRDLYAVLAGFHVVIPPIRERRADLGLLIGALHQRLFGAQHPGFASDAASSLLSYAWPYNVWELEQVLVSARALAGGGEVRFEHLPDTVRARGPTVSLDLDPREQQLHDQLFAVLREHGGNVSAAARALDKDRRQIQRWMKRFGFVADSFQ